MTLTNKWNIPQPWPSLILQHEYAPDPKRYSVTDLFNPPLIRTLRIKHWDQLGSDVSDYLWMLNGNALDKYLGDALAAQGWLTQHKMTWEVEGATVVGVADGIGGNTIVDVKVTSVYTLDNKDRLREWINQLNSYALLRDIESHQQGLSMPINRIEIHAFLRDWVVSTARRERTYPRTQLAVLDFTKDLWPFEQREEFVLRHLLDHLEHPMRECTPEERWETPPKFAVMKEGRKSALRVLDSEPEAKAWVKDNNPTGCISIQARPGERKRCKDYCAVSDVCPYYDGGNNDVG